MLSKKIFTVIIPIYNRSNTISRTLASLISSSDYIKEIIIVDDCSSDNYMDKVLNFEVFFKKITVIKNAENMGVSYSRKVGLKAAKSDYILFVDSDDCLTASSLRYAYKVIKENKNPKILISKTEYFEFGVFNKDNIEFSVFSCGGNIYDRKYLIKNNLYPHDELRMAEDEYFNEKVLKYMYYIDDSISVDDAIVHYDYPIYEVHHDDDYESLALSNWVDYSCKYHLLYKTEVVNDIFVIASNKNKVTDDLFNTLSDETVSNFIFCYFLFESLKNDESIKDAELDDCYRYFKINYDYLTELFGITSEYLIYHFNNDTEEIQIIKDGAEESCGSEINESSSFEDFIKIIKEIN